MEEIKKYTCKCKNCNREFYEKEFQITKNENKCILHCEKDDSKNMNFWNEFGSYIDSYRKESIKISNFIFPCVYKDNFEELLNKNYSQISFYECQFNNIDLNGMIFSSNIYFQDCQFNNIDLTATEFNYLEFNNITEAKDIYFSSMKVNGRFKLNNCTFDNNVYFSFSKFNDNAVFEKTVFKEEVNFKYTTFEKLAIFKNSNFEEELNLEDAIFKDKTKFLKLEAKVANRETARIIKDSFEQQNNIIEANKFYALEMEKRKDELEEDLKEGKNFFEWLVFKFHGISSNHSQDWLLSLYWIFIIGFISSYFDFNLIQHEGKYVHYELSSVFKTVGLISVVLFFHWICKIEDKLVNGSYFIICFYLVYIYSTEDYLLSLFSKTINPFSVMKTNDPINGIQLFFKIIITYLIYQLIISIRQNTRRK